MKVDTYILTARSSNGMLLYLVQSATQGNRMVPDAYLIATNFKSVQAARKQIEIVQPRYLGLSNWKARSLL